MRLVVTEDPKCPLCESAEKVKAFKVCDRHNDWWSYCFADHAEFEDEFPEPFSNQLWFRWDTPERCLVEGPTTGRLIEVRFSE